MSTNDNNVKGWQNLLTLYTYMETIADLIKWHEEQINWLERYFDEDEKLELHTNSFMLSRPMEVTDKEGNHVFIDLWHPAEEI